MPELNEWLANASPEVQEANKGLINQTFTDTAVPPPDSDSTWHTLEKVRLSGSMPEYRFALNYLEPRIVSLRSICWMHEPVEVRMKGQTYTPDFIEITTDGHMVFYEVKGHQKLGSQDRASVKFRFTAALFESPTVLFFWAKENEGGGFRIGRLPMQGKMESHKDLRGAK